MIAPFRSQHNPIDSVTWAKKEKHAPAERRYPTGDQLDPRKADLVPTTNNGCSAGKQRTPDPDSRWPQDGDERNENDLVLPWKDTMRGQVLRVESGIQEQGCGSRSKAFSGPFGFSEEALVRLEAGLQAQRELLGSPSYVTAASEICHHDMHVQAQHLPRAAHLDSLQGVTPTNNEDHVAQGGLNFQSPSRHEIVHPQPSSVKERLRNWRPRLFILIPSVIAALAFAAPEHPSINSGVIEPPPIPAVLQEVPIVGPADKQESGQISNTSAPSSVSGLKIEPATSVLPRESAEPAASPTMSSQGGAKSGQVTLPSYGNTSTRRARPGRKAYLHE
jgi:hypothetical protein